MSGSVTAFGCVMGSTSSEFASSVKAFGRARSPGTNPTESWVRDSSGSVRVGFTIGIVDARSTSLSSNVKSWMFSGGPIFIKGNDRVVTSFFYSLRVAL